MGVTQKLLIGTTLALFASVGWSIHAMKKEARMQGRLEAMAQDFGKLAQRADSLSLVAEGAESDARLALVRADSVTEVVGDRIARANRRVDEARAQYRRVLDSLTAGQDEGVLSAVREATAPLQTIIVERERTIEAQADVIREQRATIEAAFAAVTEKDRQVDAMQQAMTSLEAQLEVAVSRSGFGLTDKVLWAAAGVGVGALGSRLAR